MMTKRLIALINCFPKGSIWQTRYLCFPFTIALATGTLIQGPQAFPVKMLWFVLGALGWTFAEYCLHRWILHWNASSEIGRAIVGRLHALHHRHPEDESHVCVPLLLQIHLWGFLFLLIALFGGGTYATLLFISGFALMMVIYDITHFSTHYMTPTNRLLKKLRAHHMSHHHAHPHRRFGVTTLFWDRVFGTL